MKSPEKDTPKPQKLAHRLVARLQARSDSEHEQALIRVGFAVFAVGYCTVLHVVRGDALEYERALEYLCTIAVIYLASTVVSVALVFLRPGVVVSRRIFGMAVDMVALSLSMHFGEALTAFWYPFYLWVTLGMGFRYGNTYLAVSAALSLVGFLAVVLSTEYWHSQPNLSAGLLLALVVLPAYASTLLRKLTRAKAQAEAASLAKSRFLANVSHELRTPLNAVIGMSSLMASGRLDSDQREMVDSIQVSGRSLLDLINEILDFSRIEQTGVAIHHAPFDLHGSLARLASMLRPQARAKNLIFSIHLAADTPQHLIGDEQRLYQIMVNLAFNAIKFTEHGWVTLSVAPVAGHGGEVLRFEVSDTGIGIPAAAQGHIFESFSQADETITRRYGGTGLGLAICRQLVEQMGGQIGVDSEEGMGSRFWFELPLDLPEEPALPQIPKAANAVLLAADGQDGCFAALARLGLEVTVTDTAETTLARLAPDPSVEERGRIFVVDASVPAPESDRVIQQLRDAGFAVPAILMANPQYQVTDATRRDFSAVVQRPDDPAQVKRAICFALSAHDFSEDVATDYHSAAGRRLSILVVDDNGVNRRVMAKILEHAGHDPTLVEDAERALNALDTQDFDLVIMDIRMPGMDGVEATKLYRMSSLDRPHLPIIALTADATTEAMQEAERAGMDAYLTKPVDASRLMETIDQLVPAEPDAAPKSSQRPILGPNVLTHPRFSADLELEAHPTLDERVLANLSRLGSGSGFLTSLIEDFLEDGEQLMLELGTAAETSHAREFKDVMHGFRGSAVHIGAVRLYQTLLSLRDIGVGDIEQHGGEYVAKIEDEFRQVRAALSDYIQDHGGEELPS